jgi:hypothetical protein
MNLIELSNIFHNIAKGLDFKFYHYGLPQDLNTNGIDNSFNAGNSVGVEYPAVYAVVSNWQTATSRPNATVDVVLLFCVPQFYENDSTSSTKSILERTEQLRQLQNNFMRNLQKIGLKKGLNFPIDNPFSLQPNEGNYTTEVFTNAYNNRLIVLDTRFSMQVLLDCENVAIDGSTINTAYPMPVSDTNDYELIKPV